MFGFYFDELTLLQLYDWADESFVCPRTENDIKHNLFLVLSFESLSSFIGNQLGVKKKRVCTLV